MQGRVSTHETGSIGEVPVDHITYMIMKGFEGEKLGVGQQGHQQDLGHLLMYSLLWRTCHHQVTDDDEERGMTGLHLIVNRGEAIYIQGTLQILSYVVTHDQDHAVTHDKGRDRVVVGLPGVEIMKQKSRCVVTHERGHE